MRGSALGSGRAKADQKLNGIVEDGDAEASCCRCGMMLFIVFMFIFGLVFVVFGIQALSYSGPSVSRSGAAMAETTGRGGRGGAR